MTLHPDTRVWVKYHAKFGFMILPSITMEVAFQLYSFHCVCYIYAWSSLPKNMADARLRVFQATVGTAALHQRSETSGCIIYSVPYLIMGKLLNMHNLSHNIGKVDYFYFFRKFFLFCPISHLFKHNCRILHNRTCKPVDILYR